MQSAKHVVVVGHGMVGHRFVEALRARDTDRAWRVTVLSEETDAAYDRVGLTGYTEHWDRSQLALPGNDYAGDNDDMIGKEGICAPIFRGCLRAQERAAKRAP